MSEPTPQPKRRRRLALSVRGLMFLVLVVGGGLGWVVYRARTLREAVAAIQAANGRVYYDRQWRGGKLTPGAVPYGPLWLRSWLGPEFFEDVTKVNLDRTKADDALMAHLGHLGNLEELTLSHTEVTDAGCIHLRRLTNLKDLDLSFSQVSGGGLVNLVGLSRLEKLSLHELSIEDADLRHLSGLKLLKKLQFNSKAITDDGLIHLRGLTNLTHLMMFSPKITTKGLKNLRGMTGLSYLGLSFTGVDSLAPVSRLSKLSDLDLNDTPIDDAGLAPIEKLTGLVGLNLGRTRITDAGMIHLRPLTKITALPPRSDGRHGCGNRQHSRHDDVGASAPRAHRPFRRRVGPSSGVSSDVGLVDRPYPSHRCRACPPASFDPLR